MKKADKKAVAEIQKLREEILYIEQLFRPFMAAAAETICRIKVLEAKINKICTHPEKYLKSVGLHKGPTGPLIPRTTCTLCGQINPHIN